MGTVLTKLTVFFEEPFWVGVYEREESGRYEACKITFGAEPKDYEVYAFMLKSFTRLQFSPSIAAVDTFGKAVNPKRLQREIKNTLQQSGVGTKAQQALKLMQEQGKLERKTRSRDQREEEKALRFSQKQQKRKEKHRGH